MATVILGLASALTWGAADFGGGLRAGRTHLFTVVFFSQLVGAAIAFGLTIVRGETAPQTTDLVWSLLGGLTGGIGIAALYQALAVGRMGVVHVDAGQARDGTSPDEASASIEA